jgi:Uma2 family endonuclease
VALNQTIDPPPDLALEIDVTSKTQLDAYVALGVRELWIDDGGELKLYVLQSDQYQPVSTSPTFSQLPLPNLVKKLLEKSRKLGRSPALKALRKKIQQRNDSADFNL